VLPKETKGGAKGSGMLTVLESGGVGSVGDRGWKEPK
jgi:hypothetical protein